MAKRNGGVSLILMGMTLLAIWSAFFDRHAQASNLFLFVIAYVLFDDWVDKRSE